MIEKKLQYVKIVAKRQICPAESVIIYVFDDHIIQSVSKTVYLLIVKENV